MVTDNYAASPSTFKRLVEVAARAQAHADGGWSEADRAAWREACAEHLKVFEDWLAMGLREKQADVEVWADDEGSSAKGLMQAWSPPDKHQSLLPRWALPHQRQLFAMELEVLCKMAHRARERPCVPWEHAAHVSPWRLRRSLPSARAPH